MVQISDTGPFNLTAKDDLLSHLYNHTMGMPPKEASKFFKDYFKKSAIFNAPEVSIEIRNEVRNLARNYYFFYYYNNIHRPTELFHEDEKLLFNMINLKQGLFPLHAFPSIYLALPGHELSDLIKLNSEQLGKLFQQQFDKTFSELREKAREQE